MQGYKKDLSDMLPGILTFYRPTICYWRTCLELFHNHRLFIRKDGGQEIKPYSPILFHYHRVGTIFTIKEASGRAAYEKMKYRVPL